MLRLKPVVRSASGLLLLDGLFELPQGGASFSAASIRAVQPVLAFCPFPA
jgi:hypothetical protein